PILPIRLFEKLISKSREIYVAGSKGFIKIYPISILLFLAIVASSFYFLSKIPTGLVPYEDKGVLLYGGKLPPGSSLQMTGKTIRHISKLLSKNPYLVNWGSIGGIDLDTTLPRSDSFLGFVNLKDWSKRPLLPVILKGLIRDFSKIKSAWVFCAPIPPISGMGMVGGFEVYIQDTTGGPLTRLAYYAQKFVRAARKRPELMFVRSSINFNVPTYKIKVDREKAEAYHVSISSIYRTIAMLFGQFYVNDFNMYGRTFHVNLEAYWRFRQNPSDYRYVYVRSMTGKLIPLVSLIKVKKVAFSPILQKFNMFPAIKVSGMAAPGYTSGQVLKAVEEIAKKVLPPGYKIGFSGMSYFEVKEKAKTGMIFLVTFIFVYLLLVALYESWILPITILFTVPIGIFGAAFVFYLSTLVLPMPLENNIFFKIGLLTIAGLVAKNAILLVEFAEMERKKGVDLLSATLYAARVRFRPIIMTSFAFIAGAVPLLLSLGAGAMSRITVGLTVIAGMLFATIFGIFFIPLFYYLIVSIRERVERAFRTG
ncbi:MAG: efflux RND transporter permease subunit, partial [Thermodesulfobacteria bacterium]|nr:efflux RND transporter permease subunit [Thermodesulfobacteriota bacterium]